MYPCLRDFIYIFIFYIFGVFISYLYLLIEFLYKMIFSREKLTPIRSARTSTADTHALIILLFIGSPAINLNYVLLGDMVPSAAVAFKG